MYRATRLRNTYGLCSLWFAVCLSIAQPAQAQDKQQCVAAYESAQEARVAGEIMRARAHLLVCAAASCPGFIRRDCARWLEPVEDSIASIVVVARGPSGKDLFDVRLHVDGELVSDKLSARAVELDPGRHELRLEYGDEELERTLVVREGEHNQRVEFNFKGDGRRSGGLSNLLDMPRPSLAAYTLGAVGVVGIASFSAFAIRGAQQQRDLEASCKPMCSPAQADEVRTKFIIADISLGAGIAALGTAAYVWLRHGRESKRPTLARVTRGLSLQRSPGGGMARWQYSF